MFEEMDLDAPSGPPGGENFEDVTDLFVGAANGKSSTCFRPRCFPLTPTGRHGIGRNVVWRRVYSDGRDECV